MPANVYPAINAAGIITQFPYTEEDEFVIAHAELENGIAYTKPHNTTPLKKFTVSYSLIQRDEVTVIEDFFDLMRGDLGEFDFTDDAGTVWHKTRFDTKNDGLFVKYNEPGSHTMEVHLSAELN